MFRREYRIWRIPINKLKESVRKGSVPGSVVMLVLEGRIWLRNFANPRTPPTTLSPDAVRYLDVSTILGDFTYGKTCEDVKRLAPDNATNPSKASSGESSGDLLFQHPPPHSLHVEVSSPPPKLTAGLSDTMNSRHPTPPVLFTVQRDETVVGTRIPSGMPALSAEMNSVLWMTEKAEDIISPPKSSPKLSQEEIYSRFQRNLAGNAGCVAEARASLAAAAKGIAISPAATTTYTDGLEDGNQEGDEVLRLQNRKVVGTSPWFCKDGRSERLGALYKELKEMRLDTLHHIHIASAVNSTIEPQASARNTGNVPRAEPVAHGADAGSGGTGATPARPGTANTTADGGEAGPDDPWKDLTGQARRLAKKKAKKKAKKRQGR